MDYGITDLNKLFDFKCSIIRNSIKGSDNCFDTIKYYKMKRDYSNFKDALTEEEYKTIVNGRSARSAKRYRVNKKLTRVINYERHTAYNAAIKGADVGAPKTIVFGTATFNNKALYLSNGNQKQIHTMNRKIDKYLKEHYLYAIVNVDYGKKNERLHYHWIGITTEELELVADSDTGEVYTSKKGNVMYELKNKTYPYGYEPTLLVIDSEDNEKNHYKTTTNYLLKINNHSNKPSTKNHRIRVIGDPNYMNYLRLYELINN